MKDTGYIHDYGACMWYIGADMSVSITVVILNSETFFSEDVFTSPHSFWGLRCFQIDRKYSVGQNGSEKEFSRTHRSLIVRNWELTLFSPLINLQILHFQATLGVIVPLMFSFHFTKSLMVYVYRVIRDSKDLCPQNTLFTSFSDLAFIFCWNKCG